MAAKQQSVVPIIVLDAEQLIRIGASTNVCIARTDIDAKLEGFLLVQLLELRNDVFDLYGRLSVLQLGHAPLQRDFSLRYLPQP